ncbi:MAG TPA: AAA family ATPase, partial [Dehalococcoidia bacterium]|nr:AAA family ATPase [Dehalococcoidia bacterium]
MPAKVVSFINLKGGVGKTTLALAIGEWLAFGGQGQKVLLVDIDPQYNMSTALLPMPKVIEL